MAENILTGKLINLTRLDLFWKNAKKYIDDLDTAMGNRVSALETTVGDSSNGLVKDVADLTTRVDGHNTAIGDLQNTVEALLDSGDGSTSISGMIKTEIEKFNTETVTPIDNRVSALATIVGDSSNGLVKNVDDLRNDVNAIPDTISGAIQGLNPDNKSDDAGEFVTGASVNSDGKLVLTYGNAKSWTDEINAAKTHAEEKATAAETAAKTYTDEELAKHVAALNNPSETDTTKQSKLHIQAGDRERWNLAASQIDTFLTSTETDTAINNLTEINKWFTEHEGDYNGLLTNVNNNNTTISSHNDRLAALEGIEIATDDDIKGLFD